MDHSDFMRPNDWAHPSTPPAATATPPPTHSPGFLESRLLVFVLIGVIVILVSIVVYLYFATPKETVKVAPHEEAPSAQPRHRQPKRPPATPEEPSAVDSDGLIRKAAEARSRRKEEIAAARVVQQPEVDDDIVTEGAIVTNVSTE